MLFSFRGPISFCNGASDKLCGHHRILMLLEKRFDFALVLKEVSNHCGFYMDELQYYLV